jgi:hypothetical protein
MRFPWVAWGASALLWAGIVGCGGGPKADLPKLVPVSGTVTLDNKPLSGATVTFVPVGSTRGRGCYGGTDADGRYELMYDAKHKGAPSGEFAVTCSKFVMPDGSDFPRDSKVSPWESNAKELLPPCYSQDGMSELKATVPPDGGKNLDFKLTSKR